MRDLEGDITLEDGLLVLQYFLNDSKDEWDYIKEGQILNLPMCLCSDYSCVLPGLCLDYFDENDFF
jgi:hypothetical protein